MPVVGSSPMHPLQGCGRSAVPGAATGASTVAPHPTARDRRTTLGSQHFGCHRPHLEHRTSRQNDGYRQPDIGAERHLVCARGLQAHLAWDGMGYAANRQRYKAGSGCFFQSGSWSVATARWDLHPESRRSRSGPQRAKPPRAPSHLRTALQLRTHAHHGRNFTLP